MIVRNIEKCPKCGQWQPWRKRATKIVRGQRRVYVKCRRCGHHETVIYVEKKYEKFPNGELK